MSNEWCKPNCDFKTLVFIQVYKKDSVITSNLYQCHKCNRVHVVATNIEPKKKKKRRKTK